VFREYFNIQYINFDLLLLFSFGLELVPVFDLLLNIDQISLIFFLLFVVVEFDQTRMEQGVTFVVKVSDSLRGGGDYGFFEVV
jgi:hypothetical protein